VPYKIIVGLLLTPPLLAGYCFDPCLFVCLFVSMELKMFFVDFMKFGKKGNHIDHGILD